VVKSLYADLARASRFAILKLQRSSELELDTRIRTSCIALLGRHHARDPMKSRQAVTQAAKDAGFDLAGIAPVDASPELEYFPQWIAEGRAGEMKYLEGRDEQGRLKRASLAHVAPWARSVVVCAINYNTAQPYSTEVPDQAAKGKDEAGFHAMPGAGRIITTP
jgi:hypothetical protein